MERNFLNINDENKTKTDAQESLQKKDDNVLKNKNDAYSKFPDWDILPANRIINPRIKQK